jgi:chromatin segregation and condensation protein Rec8/ScpA/Scc1 (kleisin family)
MRPPLATLKARQKNREEKKKKKKKKKKNKKNKKKTKKQKKQNYQAKQYVTVKHHSKVYKNSFDHYIISYPPKQPMTTTISTVQACTKELSPTFQNLSLAVLQNTNCLCCLQSYRKSPFFLQKIMEKNNN